MNDLDAAIRTALRVREQRRDELRQALESGDLAAVVRWARRELGIQEERDVEEGDCPAPRLERGAGRS